MRMIYLDCSNGISGDMVLNALADLSEDPESVRANIERIRGVVLEKGADPYGPSHIHEHGHHHGHEHHHGHDHAHGHEHGHGPEHHSGHSHRSYREVMEIISQMPVSSRVKRTAEQIYAVIAKAESAVHGDPLETLHFHEVGRDQAIANVLGVAICLDSIRPDQVIVSEICDGQGTVQCAHGVLNVPVPAVKAMLDSCDLAYRQTEHEGEMVTPSGLAMVLGIGAETGERPARTTVRASEAKGARTFTEHGLIAELYEA
ncbi:MAG: DUF111 family protein [Firmicutes bacterium]|nr:DUF111 family protein [Bacillota bacterium]